MAKLLVVFAMISLCIVLTMAEKHDEDNLPKLNRKKRDIFSDVLSGIKSAGRSVIKFDSDVRQAVQTKAIELLSAGKFGPNGEIAAPAAQKVKELWDKYDQWKLNLLSK